MPLFRRKEKNSFGGGFSPGRFLTAPFRFVLGVLSGSDSELGQQVPLPKQIWRQFTRLIVFPFWLLVQVLKFIVLSWTTTRNGSAAFWGAIPLLLIMAVLAVTFAAGLVEERLTKSLHRQQVVDSELADDLDTAVLCSRRVQNITQRDTWKFIHALTLINAGMEENGMVIMGEMATPEVAGHLPSHVYQARQLLRINDDDVAYDSNLGNSRKHLECVIAKASHELDRSYIAASRLLPKVIFLQGEVDLAMKMFEEISDEIPDIIPDLAQYLIDQGNYSAADFHINRGLKTLKAAAEINPNRTEIWTIMYEILMVKKDYEAAVTELNYGLTLPVDSSIRVQIMKLQSDVFVEFSRTFTDVDSQDGFRRKLLPVCHALQRFPRNAAAINEFIDLVIYPSNENVAGWLEVEARDNVSPSNYHIINGVRDAIGGKPVTGSKHFGLAFNGDTRTAIVINDIAFILCMQKQEYSDALRLVEVAIDTWSTSAKLFQTRGEILMKLDRHAEAVEDLEYAAEQIENDPRVFTVLADCYDVMGKNDEAVVLREKSAALQQEIVIQLQALRERLADGS